MAKHEKKVPPVHPGEILLEDFLKPMIISQYRLAVCIGVPPRRINEIVLGKRAVTADTALRLGRFFEMEPQYWLNLQSWYDLEIAKDGSLHDTLDGIIPWKRVA
ncbi:HigA family addiction module antidote protein [Candidatus Ozemobacteraceae bacterium]|nr:HigA family addiction module antidote protein [Candidatus Ozemobacteraceae bacterium]